MEVLGVEELKRHGNNLLPSWAYPIKGIIVLRR
jgi:hypothetical protein